MGTAIKHSVPDRVKPSFIILTFGHSDAQALIRELKLIEHGFTSAPTQYRLYGRRFLPRDAL